MVEISIDAAKGPAGYVIDGQQRLTALAGIPEKDFTLFVSVLVCRDLEELHQEFYLAVGRLRQKPHLVRAFFAQAELRIR